MGCMNDNGGEAVCPICGFDSSAENQNDALLIRTLLCGRFLVGKETSRNGEGITYIGWDNETNTVVNIKEFYPVGLVSRDLNKNVCLAEGKEYLFNSSLLEFTELSNKLSMANDLPAILPVVKVFEEQSTAYCVTKAASGIPLTDFLLRNGGTLQWDHTRPLFLPLLATLKGLHDIGIIHRGISPDTIMVGRDGRLKLTSPCIKDIRTTGSEFTRELFPGYSAIEQYGFDKDSRDGTWTDVYALAATLFRVLVGNCPPEANTRITDDNMSISAKVADALPKHVLVALANALQILPSDRTQTIDELRRDLIKAPRGTRFDLSAAAADAEKAVKAQENRKPRKKKKSSLNYALLAILGTAIVFIALGAILVPTVFKDLFANNDISDTSSVLSVPSAVSVTTEDTYSSKEKTYTVPTLVGKSYAEIANDVKYEEVFTFEIAGKSYSDKYKKGTIISQSVEAGTNVKKETTITVNVSLGPKTVTIPTLKGKSNTDAYITLLELGFLAENIKFMDKFDDTSPADSVIGTEPEDGSSVYPDSAIIVYINTFTEESDSEDASDMTESSEQSDY